MSIDFDLRWRSVLFAITDVVELSVFIGVGIWGWSSFSNVVINIFVSYPFTKNHPTSASAADVTKLSNMLNTAWRGPFSCGVFVGGEFGLFNGELK